MKTRFVFARPTERLVDVHAYRQDHAHLLTRPVNVELGVCTSDDGGLW